MPVACCLFSFYRDKRRTVAPTLRIRAHPRFGHHVGRKLEATDAVEIDSDVTQRSGDAVGHQRPENEGDHQRQNADRQIPPCVTVDAAEKVVPRGDDRGAQLEPAPDLKGLEGGDLRGARVVEGQVERAAGLEAGLDRAGPRRLGAIYVLITARGASPPSRQLRLETVHKSPMFSKPLTCDALQAGGGPDSDCTRSEIQKAA